jgi:hypothetical protein
MGVEEGEKFMGFKGILQVNTENSKISSKQSHGIGAR